MIHLRHARTLLRPGGRPLCASGIRAWCDRHAVDWEKFTGAGVPKDEFSAIDDHYAGVLIEIAEREAAESGEQ